MKKFNDFLVLVLSKLCFVLMVIFTILVAVQVFSRYVFNSPTTWTELVARYLFVWTILLYMPVVYRQQANPSFTLFHEKLSQKALKYVDTIITFVVLFAAIYMTYWGTVMCQKMANKYIMGLNIHANIPMNLVYSSIPVGGFFLAFMCVETLLNLILKKEADHA